MNLIRFFTQAAPSRLALAVALGAGVVVSGAALEAPAYAQKKDKKRAEAETPKADYSKPFVEAYRPHEEMLNSATPDIAALKAAVPAVKAAASTADDRFVAGNFALQTGIKAQDKALQYDGLKMMLASAKVPAANLGQYNFFAGQLAYENQEWAAARQYLEAAVQAGYTKDDPRLFIAETYTKEGKPAETVAYLKRMVDAETAAGRVPEKAWLTRGLAEAYKAKMDQDAQEFAYLYALNHPSADSWGDAIVITRAANTYDNAAMLDFLRLQRRTNTFRQSGEFLEYIDTADARKLPAEIKSVIDEGYASGVLPRDNMFAKDAYALAVKGIAADKRELASFEADAGKPSATLATVMAAGDVFLSYDQPAKAETFYRAALEKPGSDKATILTRLGIAQFDQGKFAEAKATFAQVEGPRKSMVRLWSAFADQKAKGTPMAASAQ